MTKIGGIDTVRVGICSCSNHYNTKFVGRKLTVSRLRDGVLPSPRAFSIIECPIRDAHQRQDLLHSRCHFFLDTHFRGDGHVSVKLLRNELVSNGSQPGMGYKLYLGGMNICASMSKSKKEWERKKPPTSTEVVSALARLLDNIKCNKFERWLTTMTPEDWYLAAF